MNSVIKIKNVNNNLLIIDRTITDLMFTFQEIVNWSDGVGAPISAIERYEEVLDKLNKLSDTVLRLNPPQVIINNKEKV